MLGPVFYQEMLLGGRRNQLHAFRWLYAAWLVLQVAWFFFAFQLGELARSNQPDTVYIPASAPEVIGARFAQTFVLQQIILLLLATPPLVAGAVADEKKRGTLQYLLTAGLDVRHILLGKLAGRVCQVALMMLAGLPLFALLAGFGGVEPVTMLLLVVVLAMPTFAVAAASILASVFCRETREAVLALYLVGLAGGLAVWLVGGPLRWLFDPLYVLEPAWVPTRSMHFAVIGQRLLVSMLAWGLVGAACIGVAAWRLLPVYIRELESRPAQWLSVEREPVSDEPILWRERGVEGLSPVHAFKRVPQWAGLTAVAALTAAACVGILWGSMAGAGHRPSEITRALTRFDAVGLMNLFGDAYLGFFGLGVLALLVASLVVGVRCSGSITGEREKQTWEALLLTPLSARQLVHGKLWGVMGASYWYLLAYAAPAVVFSVLGGLYAMFWVVLWLGLTVPAMYGIGAAGIWCSARSRSSWRSLLGTLAWGYLGGVIVFVVTVPAPLIVATILYLILLIVDMLTGLGLTRTSGAWLQTFLVAGSLALGVIFWGTARFFFLNWAQRWIADRERTRHWYDEPIYRRSRRPLEKPRYAR